MQEQDVTEEPSTGRTLGFERALVLVVALLILVAGVATLVVGAGWLGAFRAEQPILDPLIVQWMRNTPQVAIPVAITSGVALFLLGNALAARAIRPEPRPGIQLEDGPAGALTITPTALAQAIRNDAETITGVSRARARMAGSRQRPHLRLTLTLQDGAKVRPIWDELQHKVLPRARQALGTQAVPMAIRLELDRAPKQRVR